MKKGRLLKKEEFSKMFLYLGWAAFGAAFILIAIAFVLFEKTIVLLVIMLAAAMQIGAGFFIRTLQRTDLYIYENGIKIPKAKLDIWNDTWGLPDRDFIPYEDVYRIYAKIDQGPSEPQGVFLEMVDGREVVLMWGSKDKLRRVYKELIHFKRKYG